MKMSRKDALEILNALVPEQLIELSPAAAAKLLMRIELEHIPPCHSGLSLHCWSNEYVIDGARYEVCGELATGHVIVHELVPIV